MLFRSEIGQVSAQIREVLPAARIVSEIIGEYQALVDGFRTGRSGRFDFGGEAA